MKIHVIESMKLTKEQKARLEKLGKVKYFNGMPNVDELLKRVENADVVVSDFAHIELAIPKMKSGVQLITIRTTGVGWLPLKEAAAKGIKIANVPGHNTESAGELGIGLLMTIARKLHMYARGEPKPEVETCLYGKIVGILGAGRIGTYIGKIAEASGMKVLFWKRRGDLSKVLENSDIIYCALPLTDETKGLLGEKEFAMMKRGSYFVTTSDYRIYDSDALLKALKTNLAGAAMDLDGINTGDYKAAPYLKLRNHPKIFVTPHIGSLTDYTFRRGYDMMIDNIEAFVKGRPINIVN